MPDTRLLQMREVAVGDTVGHFNSPVLHVLDSFTHLTLQGTTLLTPPSSPAQGDSYWIPVGAGPSTDEWTGWENRVVTFYDGWQSFQPYPGMIAYLQAQGVLARYEPSRAWATIASVFRQHMVLSSSIANSFDIGPSRAIVHVANTFNLLQARVNYRSVGDTGNIQVRMFSADQTGEGGSELELLQFDAARLLAQPLDQLLAIEHQPTVGEWIFLEILAVTGTPLDLRLELHYTELL